MNDVKLDIDEIYKIIGFLNDLYGYIKGDMSSEQLIQLSNNNIYTYDKNQNKFTLIGDLHIIDKNKKKIPNLVKLIEEQTFTFQGYNVFELKKDVRKKDIIEGYINNNNQICIEYISKSTGDKKSCILGQAEFDEKIKDGIVNTFNKLETYVKIKENIEISYEDYNKNNGDLYEKENKIILDDNSDLFASIPKKFLQKMGKDDKAYFNLYKYNEYMNYTEFIVESKDYTIKQLFVTV